MPGIPIEVLIVDDDPEDIRFTLEALKEAKLRNRFSSVNSGEEAQDYLLRRPPHESAPRPDLILLDLNMPGMDGRELLKWLKDQPELKKIPVVILTTSSADADIARSYELNAACYITKPVDLDEFVKVVRTIEDFWLSVVQLPPR